MQLKVDYECAIIDGSNRWILIQDYPIPPGYSIKIATVALQIPTSYPTTQIDMVYVFPDLKRTDNKVIKATSVRMNIGGKGFQRWSRHRTAVNPWRPDLDDISTHMGLVEEWFMKGGE
ncbi:MAG: hypothetical protein PF693_09200 [Spirochaetia bacterium]|jgi:hypothetical protein|nr:hypothetical protein [Spirochaetia bacterium]